MLAPFAEELARPVLFLVLGTAFVAGFVRGMAGFGAALILTPVFSAFYTPAVAIPVLGFADWVMSMPMVLKSFRRCAWREVLPLALAAVVTVPLGSYVLAATRPDVLRIAISIFVLLAVAALASGWRYRGTPSMPVTLGVGGLAGVMGGAIGMSGPPVVLFWLGGQADAAQARTNTLAFFGVSALATMTMYVVNSLLTPRAIVLAIILMPIYGLGLFLGSRAFRLLPERVFRFVAFSLIAAISVATLVAALV
jgi:uncharacterized membrane protein YfcA